jgi:hypothetical protein
LLFSFPERGRTDIKWTEDDVRTLAAAWLAEMPPPCRVLLENGQCKLPVLELRPVMTPLVKDWNVF